MKKLLALILSFLFPLSALASVQVITANTWSSFAGTATSFPSIQGVSTNTGSDTTPGNFKSVMPVEGTFNNMRIVIDFATTTKSYTATFRKNGTNTALTCTIAAGDTTCSDVTHSVSVAVGDKVTYGIAASPGNVLNFFKMTMDFTPTVANKTFLTMASEDSLNTTRESYTLAGGGVASVAEAGRQNVFSEAGVLSNLLASTTNPGAGKTRNFGLRINLTSTSTMTCTVDGNAPNYCTDNSNTQSVSAGDLIGYATVPSGTPAATAGMTGNMVFVPTTAGNFDFLSAWYTGGSTNYLPIHGGISFNTKEASTTQVANNMTMTAISARITVAPGAGKSRIFALRQNSATTSLTCTIADTNTTCSGTSSVSIADGDLLGIAEIAVGGPTTASGSVGLVANRNSVAAPVTLSGTLYAMDETTPATIAGRVIKVAIGTSTPGIFSTTTIAGSGVWNITPTDFTSSFLGERILAWVDGDTDFRAATFTKASSTANNISNIDLFQNRVTLKMEGIDATSTTNSDLAFYNGANDTDIQFTTSGADLSVNKSQELHIAPGTEFAPGGTVTLHGNASTTNPDGDLHLAYGARQDGISTSSILTMGANAFTLAGNWFASSSAIYSGANTTTFNSTSTLQQKNIIATSTPFNILTFNGSGGLWTFGANQASTTGDLTITAGTMTAPPTLLTIGGNYTNSGTFTHNSGTVYFDSASAQTLSGTMINTSAFNHTVFVGASTKTFNNNASTTDLTINSGATIAAPSSGMLTISGNYTNNGTFTRGSIGIVYFDSTSPQSLSGTMTGTSNMFSDVAFNGSGTKTFASNASTTDNGGVGSFTINTGATVVAPALLTIGGNYTNSGTFTHNSGTVYFPASGLNNLSGTMTGTSAFNNVIAVGKTFNASASTTDFTITADTVTAPSTMLTIGGNYTNNGTFTNNGGTVYFSSTSAQTLSGTMVDISAFGSTTFIGAGTKTFSNNASTSNKFTINSGAIVVAPALLTVGGNYTNSGTFANNSGTVYFSSTSAQTLSGTMTNASAFKNLTILNTSGTGSTQSVIFANVASTTGAFTMMASTSAQFLANATSSFSSVAFNGTSAATRTWLRSSSPGTRYGFVATTSATVSYVDVQDASSCGDTQGLTISASDGTNYDSTNNCGWDFVGATFTLAASDDQIFAFGDASTPMSLLTVTDGQVPSIKAANALRIAIATSTTGMTWYTVDTSASFGGTAVGKVSNPVSYEGDGSVLVVPIGNDFASADTLTISGLSFSNFTAASAPLPGLKVFVNGASDQTTKASNSKNITIKGTVTGDEHAGGQAANIIDVTASSVSNALLYAFKLTLAGGEEMNITTLPLTLTGIQSFTSGDVASASLYIDYNGNKTVDAGDTQVGGAGSVSISGETGTITFSSSFTATTTRDYVLTATLSNMNATGNSGLNISLTPSNVLASGLTSLLSTTPVSQVALSTAQHVKIPRGNSMVGGAAPAGQGVRGGGGNSGGQQIGSDPNFFPPTDSNGSYTQWTTPDNAFSSDGAYATSATTWQRQEYGGFGFSIPGTDTITGIEVKLELSGSTAAGAVAVALSWDGGTSTTTVQTTGTLSGTDTVVTLGGAADVWGRTWSADNFSDANFKVRLVALPSGNTVQVDAIQVNVHHVASGGGQGGGGQVRNDSSRYMASVYEAVHGLFQLFVEKLSHTFISF
jgi:Fe-S cluster assembly iron-binding protein IscA